MGYKEVLQRCSRTAKSATKQQYMCLNKKKNTQTVSPCKTWESWIICVTFWQACFQQIPLFRFQTLKTSEQYPWFWEMSIIYILTISFNLNAFIYIYISSSGFTSHFTTISAKNSIAAGWWRIGPIKFLNSNYVSSRLWCFREKHLSVIVNIFCKSYSINHKCWICLSIFTFMSTSEACYWK